MKPYYQEIINYYHHGEVTYRDVWDLETSMAIHFGYWDKGIWTLRQSLQRFNEVLYQQARISKQDKVLDAGCGVGGSSIYLAKQCGCQVTGISLSERQVQSAIQNSRQHQVADKTQFIVADYTQTPFEAESFDVIWALESICYAENKADFIQEAFRLLKKGGRLIVADGFKTKNNAAYTAEELAILQKWYKGWALKDLETTTNFQQYAHEIGFTNTIVTDVTQPIFPSARRLYYLAKAAQIVGWIKKTIGQPYGNRYTIGNGIGADHQYRALKQGLWQYAIFYAEKGKTERDADA